MRRYFIALAVSLAAATSALAQDAITLGSGEAAAGGAASVPVSILDRSATPLGSDSGTGNRIQGIAFKILFPAELVQSISFARGGVMGGLTPLYETTLQGSGWISYVASFAETTNVIPFMPSSANQIGTVTVTLAENAPAGSTAALRLDPPSAVLSNQSSTTRETVASGTLTLLNSTVIVNGALAAPASLLATATSPTQISLAWNGVGGATRYDVYRRSDGGAYAVIGSATATSFSDSNGVVAGKTYLYRVRAVDVGGGTSPGSNIDAATTIFFADDPVVAGTTLITAVHLTELRAAVNAFRAAVSLSQLPADATIAVGSAVRAEHVNDLRSALDDARTAAGIAPIGFTGTIAAGVTPVAAVHVQELRAGVQ